MMWSRREATDQPSAAAPLVIAFASHSNEILVSDCLTQCVNSDRGEKSHEWEFIGDIC